MFFSEDSCSKTLGKDGRRKERRGWLSTVHAPMATVDAFDRIFLFSYGCWSRSDLAPGALPQLLG